MANVKLHVGKQFSRNVGHASDPYFTQSMQSTMRELTDTLLDILDQFSDASAEIMEEAIEPTMDLADYYCPKDTHRLVNSRFIEVRNFRGKPRLEAGYARGGVPHYGAFVHEATWVPHRAPTRSKWLQAAMMEDLNNIYDRLGQGYRAFMGA